MEVKTNEAGYLNRLSRNSFQPMITQILKRLHRFFRGVFNLC